MYVSMLDLCEIVEFKVDLGDGQQETMTYRGRQMSFCEFGWLGTSRGLCSLQRDVSYDCLLWFIDEHDTHEEIQLARSHVLGFVLPQHGPTALCIVLNRGRPFAARHAIRGCSWIDDDSPPQPVRTWSSLATCTDARGLCSLYTRGVYLTELSYGDEQAATLCLDWLLDPQQLEF